MFDSQSTSVSFLVSLILALSEGALPNQSQTVLADNMVSRSDSVVIAINGISEKRMKTHPSFCEVVGLRTGQLALRRTPGGTAIAGLNNGNTVHSHSQQGIWDYVQVVSGPNRRVTGLWGWVNGKYLACSSES